MKKTTKRGFTIVELVIVIAVIAILAAVLIPTFSNIIKTSGAVMRSVVVLTLAFGIFDKRGGNSEA